MGLLVRDPGTGTQTTADTGTLAGDVAVNSATTTAFQVGAAATNPQFQVDASATTVRTGLKVTGAAAASGLAVAVVSSGAAENLTVDAKGSGTITLNGTGTGGITATRALTTSAGITNTGTISTTALTATAGITSSGPTGAGIGYATGAGGAVSQLTDRTTGVTLSKLTGTITTQATSLAAAALVSFTVTNTTVAIGDTVLVSIQSGPTTVGTIAYVTAVAAGSFQITLKNGHASTADTGAALINFAVIKAVSA